jgi:hypothetical protein
MTRTDLAPIPTDELWALHEKIAAALAARLTLKRGRLKIACCNLIGEPKPSSFAKKLAADPIQQFSRNSRIRTSRHKLGRGGESNRAG